jgi:hypothetical protein
MAENENTALVAQILSQQGAGIAQRSLREA